MNKKVKPQNQSTVKGNEPRKPRWLTANQKYYPNLMEDRKRLKNEMTGAEKVLWEELRNKKGSHGKVGGCIFLSMIDNLLAGLRGF
ncbi:hypothetical protein MNBD_BACTEROID01-1493 [hydrothermal vent metagenome]|uniref:DUF559 domain-containing protein n=1 Tax=hydrothermal vent metagenome TaxID=652676 RepID=A0A3B0TSD3_9ZZZZ